MMSYCLNAKRDASLTPYLLAIRISGASITSSSCGATPERCSPRLWIGTRQTGCTPASQPPTSAQLPLGTIRSRIRCRPIEQQAKTDSSISTKTSAPLGHSGYRSLRDLGRSRRQHDREEHRDGRFDGEHHRTRLDRHIDEICGRSSASEHGYERF
jgi:hypothetical protein